MMTSRGDLRIREGMDVAMKPMTMTAVCLHQESQGSPCRMPVTPVVASDDRRVSGDAVAGLVK